MQEITIHSPREEQKIRENQSERDYHRREFMRASCKVNRIKFFELKILPVDLLLRDFSRSIEFQSIEN